MRVDGRVALPAELLLAALEFSFAELGRAANATADVFATARLKLLLARSDPRPSSRQEGIADVVVLSTGRKHER